MEKNLASVTCKSINKLKDYHWKEIFKHLSVMEKIKVSNVCKKWNFIINKSWDSLNLDGVFQKEFTKYDKFNKKFIPFIKYFLQKYGAQLNTLSITAFYNNNLDYHRILKIIEQYCNNLTKLSLTDYTFEKNIFTDANIGQLFKKNANLANIYMKCIETDGTCLYNLRPLIIEEFIMENTSLKNSKHLCNFLKQLKNIKKINCQVGCSYNNELVIKMVKSLILSNCKNIEEFTTCSNDKIDGLSELIFKQKNIRKLMLQDTIVVDKEFLDNLTKEHLEVLQTEFHGNDLSFYSLSEFKNLKNLQCAVDLLTEDFMKGLTKCKNLKELDIYVYNDYYDNNLSKTGLGYFSQLLMLESLKLNIRDKEVDSIVKALSRLKYLQFLNFEECKFSGIRLNNLYPKSFRNLKCLIVGGTNITDKELIDLVTHSPKLEKIDVSSCENITKNFCEAANTIKNNRLDKHFLTLIVYTYDAIYKLKKIYNNKSLILIETEALNKDMPNFGFN